MGLLLLLLELGMLPVLIVMLFFLDGCIFPVGQLKLDAPVELQGDESIGCHHDNPRDEEEQQQQRHVPESYKCGSPGLLDDVVGPHQATHVPRAVVDASKWLKGAGDGVRQHQDEGRHPGGSDDFGSMGFGLPHPGGQRVAYGTVALQGDGHQMKSLMRLGMRVKGMQTRDTIRSLTARDNRKRLVTVLIRRFLTRTAMMRLLPRTLRRKMRL
ncbi:hypothetical protein INR49_025532 [Caranx melampygus]|nr:hypothetical protein INR49_025532 [Caranx melampygus]